MVFNPEAIKHLKIGGIYDACGNVAIIKDILKSKTSGTVILFVRFVRNIGDSRPHDILTLAPGKWDMGISEWIQADSDLIVEATKKRMKWIVNSELKQFEGEKQMGKFNWKAMENCPVCGEEAASWCKCSRRDSTCKNNHHWHMCEIHGEIVIGKSDHSLNNICTC